MLEFWELLDDFLDISIGKILEDVFADEKISFGQFHVESIGVDEFNVWSGKEFLIPIDDKLDDIIAGVFDPSPIDVAGKGPITTTHINNGSDFIVS